MATEQSSQPPGERPKIRLRPLDQSARLDDSKPKWVQEADAAAKQAASEAPAVAAPQAVNLADALPELRLTPPMRLVGGMVAAICVVVGVLISLNTAPAGVLVGVALAAVTVRLTWQAVQWRVPRAVALWAVCAAMVAGLALLCFAWLPVWHAQAAQFGEHLVELAEKATAGKAGVTRVTGAAQAGLNRLAESAARLGAGWFFQVLLAMAAVLVLPVVKPTEALGAVALRLCSRIGLWCASRLLTATALGVVAGIGLSQSGVTAPWFVAGCVWVVGLFFRPMPETMVSLALVAAPWFGRWAPAVVGTLVTGAVLWFGEKKLYWFLYKLPALKEGIILPEIVEDRGGAPRRSLSGLLVTVARAAVALAVLAAIGAVLWIFVPPWQESQRRTDALARAKSAAELERFVQRYPESREALLKLVKVHASADDMPQAIACAERLAKWAPAPPKPPANWREEIYQRVVGTSVAAPPVFNRAEGYEILINHISNWEVQVATVLNLGEKALAVNDSSLPGLKAVATAQLSRGNVDRSLEYAQRGLQLNPNGTGWHFVLAQVYLEKKDWAKCIAECDAELAVDPDDQQAASIKNTATLAQSRGLR